MAEGIGSILSSLPPEIKEEIKKMMKRQMLESGNPKEVLTIEVLECMDRIQKKLHSIAPQPAKVCGDDEGYADVLSDVKEYVTLMEAGLDSFIAAHKEKWGQEAIDNG